MSTRADNQLERLLLALPHLDEDTEMPLDALAERVGCDVRTLLRDLQALDTRDRDVAGFVEAVELYLGPGAVGARSSHFRRPMRLTRAELAALDLGLGLLALERPMEEQGTIAAARERVRGVAVAPPRVVRQGTVAAPLEEPELPVAVEPAPDDQLEVFGRLCQARDERRAVRLTYARAEDTSHEQRVVHPWAIVRAHQHLYIVAWCTTVTAVRVFRLDRVREVVLDGASFDIPDGFDVAELQHDGRLFAGQLPDDVLVVRYAPRIARWIAEREGVALDDDGSVTVSWPLADEGWAVRHVLQYGVDAEVRSPAHIRQALVARLEAMASSMPPPG